MILQIKLVLHTKCWPGRHAACCSATRTLRTACSAAKRALVTILQHATNGNRRKIVQAKSYCFRVRRIRNREHLYCFDVTKNHCLAITTGPFSTLARDRLSRAAVGSSE
jgi:hypothetical protein